MLETVDIFHFFERDRLREVSAWRQRRNLQREKQKKVVFNTKGDLPQDYGADEADYVIFHCFVWWKE